MWHRYWGKISVIHNINVIHSAGAIRVNKCNYLSGVSKNVIGLYYIQVGVRSRSS